MNQLLDNRFEKTSDTQDQIKMISIRNSFFGGDLHPWRRYFARFVDTMFFAIPIYYIVLIFVEYIIPDTPQFLDMTLPERYSDYVVMCAIWLPLEAMCITYFGATPGKWLFGIRVMDKSGSRLSFGLAMQRTLYILLVGEGLRIPILTSLTNLLAYDRILNTGKTLWDDACNSVVTHISWSNIRTIFCVVTVVASWVLFIIYFFLVLNIID